MPVISGRDGRREIARALYEKAITWALERPPKDWAAAVKATNRERRKAWEKIESFIDGKIPVANVKKAVGDWVKILVRS